MEQQLDPTRCHVRGVRMLAGWLFFISLDSARSLQYLLRHSFRLVPATDPADGRKDGRTDSDATVSLLLAAFVTIVGDVERRFFCGVDTGERLFRFRLKGHAKLPRHITVGGCRIQVRRMSPAPNSGRLCPWAGRAAVGMASQTGFSNPTGMNRRFQSDFDPLDFSAASSSLTTARKSVPKIGQLKTSSTARRPADVGRSAGPCKCWPG